MDTNQGWDREFILRQNNTNTKTILQNYLQKNKNGKAERINISEIGQWHLLA